MSNNKTHSLTKEKIEELRTLRNTSIPGIGWSVWMWTAWDVFPELLDAAESLLKIKEESKKILLDTKSTILLDKGYFLV